MLYTVENIMDNCIVLFSTYTLEIFYFYQISVVIQSHVYNENAFMLFYYHVLPWLQVGRVWEFINVCDGLFSPCLHSLWSVMIEIVVRTCFVFVNNGIYIYIFQLSKIKRYLLVLFE